MSKLVIVETTRNHATALWGDGTRQEEAYVRGVGWVPVLDRMSRIILVRGERLVYRDDWCYEFQS